MCKVLVQTARGFAYENFAKELLQAVVALLRSGIGRLEKMVCKKEDRDVLEGWSSYFFSSEFLNVGEAFAREQKGGIRLRD